MEWIFPSLTFAAFCHQCCESKQKKLFGNIFFLSARKSEAPASAEIVFWHFFVCIGPVSIISHFHTYLARRETFRRRRWWNKSMVLFFPQILTSLSAQRVNCQPFSIISTFSYMSSQFRSYQSRSLMVFQLQLSVLSRLLLLLLLLIVCGYAAHFACLLLNRRQTRLSLQSLLEVNFSPEQNCCLKLSWGWK